MTLHEVVARARRDLESAGIERAMAGLDAELLARHVLNWDRARWLSDRGSHAPAGFTHAYEALIARRRRREPIAYIRGIQEFWGREFLVRPGVLIPRPETELTVEAALDLIQPMDHPSVVDVGTGTGCIAVTLALERPNAAVNATDVSSIALDLARHNAQRLGANDVRFLTGACLAGVRSAIDLIVSNPPYVAESERAILQPEVQHEPENALFAGSEGVDVIRELVAQAARRLKPGGCLVLEIGCGQLELVQTLIRKTGALSLAGVRRDLQGIPRVVIARRITAAESAASDRAESDRGGS